MPGDLIYLYAIVADDSPVATALQSGARTGLDSSATLFPIAASGLAAIASAVPSALQDLLAGDDDPPDLERIAPFAVQHEETIRSLFPLAPALIPLSFGAVYRDRASVAAFLTGQEATLRRLLTRLDQTEEWTFKVYRDESRAAAAAEAASPVLRDLDAAIATASPGRAHLLRKRRDQVRRAEIDRAEQEVLESILAALESRVIATKADDLIADPASAERLVLKVACLLHRDDAGQFAAWIGNREPEWTSAGLRLELTGPWAPYSFVRAAS